jgi:hypothetical protein
MLKDVSRQKRIGTINVPVLPFRTALFTFSKDRISQEKFSNWEITYERTDKEYCVKFTADHVSFAGFVPLGILNKRTKEFSSVFGLNDSLAQEFVTSFSDVEKCDVCETRKAKNLYILWNEKDEKISYVSSGCLTKFFEDAQVSKAQSIVPNVIFYVDSSPADLFYRAKESYAQAVKIDSTTALAAALFLVEKSGKGYISKKQQEYGSTASEMERILILEDNKKEFDEIRNLLIEAAVLKQCILEETINENNEFVLHLRDILVEDKITKHSFGLIAATPTFYNRFSRNRKLVELGKPLPGEGYAKGFIGEIGQRVSLTNIYVEETRRLHHGGFLVSFRSPENKKIIWFTSNISNVPRSHIECKVSGLVKKHDTYKGVDTTIISRCKIFETANIVE